MNHYAVLGHPISHSFSPHIFKCFSEQSGHLLDYQAIEVMLSDLGLVLSRLQAKGYRGVSLTAPLKEQAYLLAHESSARACSAQAVNMLTFREDGSYYGDNTDGVGLIRDLCEAKKFTLRNKKVVILGAGGAVRGILPALLGQEPHEVVILNRSLARAEQLVKEYSGLPVGTLPLPLAGEGQGEGAVYFQAPHFLIHATTAGENFTPPPITLSPETCCYDLSYGKAPSAFLRWAQNQGAKICYNGLAMLIEQAAEAFYQWEQVKINTDVLRLLLE